MSLLAIDMQGSPVKHGNGASISYMPFGFVVTLRGAQIGYSGQWIEVSGVYVLGNGYRPYLPTLAAFQRFDSLSPFGPGSLNGYVYCKVDPVNHVDPSGAILGVAFGARHLFGFFLARRSHVSAPMTSLKQTSRARALSVISGYDSPAVTPLSQRRRLSMSSFADDHAASSFSGSTGSSRSSHSSLRSGTNSEIDRALGSGSSAESVGWETTSSVFTSAPLSAPFYPNAPPPTASPAFSPSVNSSLGRSSRSSLRTPSRGDSLSSYSTPSPDFRSRSYSQ